MIDVNFDEPTDQSSSGSVFAISNSATDDKVNDTVDKAEVVDDSDETSTIAFPSFASYLTTLWPHTEPEHQEVKCNYNKKAKLGTILGVYLPSIQHTLNVQMFLRLLWIVGIAGVLESFFMVFLCCFTIFLTTISLSAIATNEDVKSGGAYYMISRNLGSEFGGAIGILYFVANALATSLHLIGGIEILLLFIAPELPHFGSGDAHDSHHAHDALINDFRIYATIFLILEFIICALGVKFVQIFAPLSLACVIISIISVYIGSFVRNSSSSPTVCMLGDVLLRPEAYTDQNNTIGCNKTELGIMWKHFCLYNESADIWTCDKCFTEKQPKLVFAIPGLFSGQTERNIFSKYMEEGEAAPGKRGDYTLQVVQDMSSNFFHLLAIFFPCVTDIMTGANMSGDLKNPRKSLPIGTIAAQLTTSFIYLSLVFVYGGSVDGSLLRDKYGVSLNYKMVAAELAWPSKWVVLVGSFTATFGAALQCLCCAPRILQSIAKDDIIPWLKFFSPVTKYNEPFRALILSTLMAECAILIGGVDHLSPIVDFFFLISYFSVNFACALQSLLKSPNWRPTFKYYHWSLSVLGAALCVFIMFGTHWYYSLGVVVLLGLIYKYIEYHKAESDWGEGFQGLALSAAQFSLLRINNKPADPKFWRPQIMVMLKVSETADKTAYEQMDLKLLDLAHQFKKGQGLTVVTSFVESSDDYRENRKRVNTVETVISNVLEDKRIPAFMQVLLTKQMVDDVDLVLKCTGVGALKANTLVVGWPARWREANDKKRTSLINFFTSTLRVTESGKSVIVAKGLGSFPASKDKLHGTIDVWVNDHDGGVMILLSHLLKQHRVWRSCKLRIFILVDQCTNEEKLSTSVNSWLDNLRIQCVAKVVRVMCADDTNDLGADVCSFNVRYAKEMNKIILQHIRSTRLVILELPAISEFNKEFAFDAYYDYVEILTANLNRVLLIKGHGQNVLT